MNKISKARKVMENVDETTIINAFDVIGREFLQGETIYYNDKDGINDAFVDFKIYDLKEILDYTTNNEDYNITDKYIIFDGFSLISMNDLEYCKKCIYDKMNGETAEIILGEIE